MNILGLFVVVPVLMILFLFLCKDIKSIRAVMVTGATALLALTAVLVVTFLRERAANPDAEMPCRRLSYLQAYFRRGIWIWQKSFSSGTACLQSAYSAFSSP